MSAGTGTLEGVPISVGTVLAKKYRVERLIGEGGTGIVVAASHVQLGQEVAIKVLRSALASDEIRLRFAREAAALGKIQSEHVVLVLDVGTLEDGSPFMVMEHLEGRDLARVLKEDGPLPVEDAVDCMLQLCEALGEAHAAGIVHRDLKPANLFLTRHEDGGPHIKVVDFGISKILDDKLKADGGPREVTSAFAVLGSPRYMAPEQLRNSKDVDGRADLWSVGTVLFQLVTGRHAFDAESNVQASLRVLTGEPESLSALAPHAPTELEAVVSKCLAKDVADRFQTADELAQALRPFASQRTRDSIDSMRHARSTRVEVALAVASASSLPPPAPPRALAPAPPPPSGSGPASRSEPPMVASVRRAPVASAGKWMKIAIAAGGLVSVLVVFGVLTLAKSVAVQLGIVRSPLAEEPAAASAAPPLPQAAMTARDPVVVPSVVPLDAAPPRP